MIGRDIDRLQKLIEQLEVVMEENKEDEDSSSTVGPLNRPTSLPSAMNNE
jgi:hypothetical protein